MPKPSNRRVHFAPLTGEIRRIAGKWKPDFVTTHMFQGKPDKLTKAEAAEVNALMSSNPQLFHLTDRDRERDAELTEKDVPEMEDMMSVYERYKDAKSMGWVNRHGNQLKAPPLPPIEWAFEEVEDALPENAIQVDDPLPALDPRPKLPPIQWDFEDSLPPREHPMPVDEEAPPLPSLHWDFEELDDSLPNPVPVAEGAPPLPVAEEAPPLLPLKWNASSLPALKWEFKEPSSLPPLEWAFQEPPPEAPMPEDEDSMPVDVEALPPLDGNLRDLLHRAYLAMERATDKLSEFDEKGDPARDMARNQIQAGMQMQALYRQVEMYGRLREGMGSTLHVLRSVGPPALGQ